MTAIEMGRVDDCKNAVVKIEYSYLFEKYQFLARMPN